MSTICSMAATLLPSRNAPISRLKSRVRQDGVGDKRVHLSLLTEGGHRTMAWNESHVIAQRPQPGRDGFDQVCMIAAREIRASNGPLKKHIADLGEARLAMEKDDVSRRRRPGQW